MDKFKKQATAKSTSPLTIILFAESMLAGGGVVNANVKDHAILYIDNYDSTVNVTKEDSARCVVWDK